MTLSSCKGDHITLDEKPDQTKEFYGTPFDKMPKLGDVVMYEANQRVYAANGSFKAITQRLDKGKPLGDNALWLMPINIQGKEKAYGSPYCVQDYTKTEPEYGTLDGLRLLVKEAHQREMAVIIDWVPIIHHGIRAWL